MLARLIDRHHGRLAVRKACEVDAHDHRFAVHTIALGNASPDVPAVGFFAGVHGVERIGSQVLLAFLEGLLARLAWDRVLNRQLESMRLVFMPIVNPAGMWRGRRCNGNGVDLMRNAPVESLESVPFLVGGQRYSARLPWFRGWPESAMEVESEALCQVVTEELQGHSFSIALDCHSGFGLRDRIWFPYAHTRKPIPRLAEMHALHQLFASAYPHHDYIFEPQSRQYLTHGDLWDHLYGQAQDGRGVFLPLTLEMGSWRWVRKNPLQLFARGGLFNPLPRHRLQRVLRRHLVWLEFLALAACAWREWMPLGTERARQERRALLDWYPELAQ